MPCARTKFCAWAKCGIPPHVALSCLWEGQGVEDTGGIKDPKKKSFFDRCRRKLERKQQTAATDSNTKICQYPCGQCMHPTSTHAPAISMAACGLLVGLAPPLFLSSFLSTVVSFSDLMLLPGRMFHHPPSSPHTYTYITHIHTYIQPCKPTTDKK